MQQDPKEVILVFDIGKTNKKRILFDTQLQVVDVMSIQLQEIVDEDGFPCEDLTALTQFILSSVKEVLADKNYYVKGINFSAYGASLVYLDKDGKPLTPLYNYLKPYPQDLLNQFYNKYGGEIAFSRSAASPVLGNLNSGMQVYWLKYEQPANFQQVACVLHLPQYLAYLITGKLFTEMTSIGCHTNLWDFDRHVYQDWLSKENLLQLFPKIHSDAVIKSYKHSQKNIIVGTGLHDSSAALVPYLRQKNNKFLLLSTGTWCISLNPFNNNPLTEEELKQDCLCYLQPDGTPIKAARYFGGHKHDETVKEIAKFYQTTVGDILATSYNDEELTSLLDSSKPVAVFECLDFKTAYLVFMFQLMLEQKKSTDLVLNDVSVDEIIVEGGFANNALFMQLLKLNYPGISVTSSQLAQGSALGAAMMIKDEIWKN